MVDFDELEKMKHAALPIGGPPGQRPPGPPPVEVSDLEFEGLADVIVAQPVLRKHSKGGIELPPDQQRTPFHVAIHCGPEVKHIAAGETILAAGGANFDTDVGRVFFFREKDVLAIVKPAKEPVASEEDVAEGEETVQ